MNRGKIIRGCSACSLRINILFSRMSKPLYGNLSKPSMWKWNLFSFCSFYINLKVNCLSTHFSPNFHLEFVILYLDSRLPFRGHQSKTVSFLSKGIGYLSTRVLIHAHTYLQQKCCVHLTKTVQGRKLKITLSLTSLLLPPCKSSYSCGSIARSASEPAVIYYAP